MIKQIHKSSEVFLQVQFSSFSFQSLQISLLSLVQDSRCKQIPTINGAQRCRRWTHTRLHASTHLCFQGKWQEPQALSTVSSPPVDSITQHTQVLRCDLLPHSHTATIITHRYCGVICCHTPDSINHGRHCINYYDYSCYSHRQWVTHTCNTGKEKLGSTIAVRATGQKNACLLWWKSVYLLASVEWLREECACV